MNSKAIKYFIIGTFVSLYLIVSVISTIHVVQFFDLSNPKWLSVSLAIAFELGAAASLASIIALDKMNKFMVWGLFIILTLMQAMGNSYYAYSNIHDYTMWSELFGLSEEEPIFQKRILSVISGAILPIVALGFIKSLVDYIKPEDEKATENSIASESGDATTPIDLEKVGEINVSGVIVENIKDVLPESHIEKQIGDEQLVENPSGDSVDSGSDMAIEAEPSFDQVNPISYVNSNHRNTDYGPDPTNLK